MQEAWLNASRAGTDGVQNLAGWLTTVVARVCLDMLRSRRSRREELVGEPPPEPVRAAGGRRGAVDPEREAELADSVGLALLVVLDQLAPAERLAFVLHDLFGMPFEEIAPVVGPLTGGDPAAGQPGPAPGAGHRPGRPRRRRRPAAGGGRGVPRRGPRWRPGRAGRGARPGRGAAGGRGRPRTPAREVRGAAERGRAGAHLLARRPVRPPDPGRRPVGFVVAPLGRARAVLRVHRRRREGHRDRRGHRPGPGPRARPGGAARAAGLSSACRGLTLGREDSQRWDVSPRAGRCSGSARTERAGSWTRWPPRSRWSCG